jgi:hypothetical protein
MAAKAPNAEANAEKYFAKSATQDETLKRSVRNERAQEAAKTAKLRALRLAKEQGDKAEADKLAAEKGTQKPSRRKAARTKPAGMVRMTY